MQKHVNIKYCLQLEMVWHINMDEHIATYIMRMPTVHYALCVQIKAIWWIHDEIQDKLDYHDSCNCITCTTSDVEHTKELNIINASSFLSCLEAWARNQDLPVIPHQPPPAGSPPGDL